MIIKVLGTGCPNCLKLENNTKLALEKSGIEATVLKISDIVEIMEYDIMSNPGLVIDEKVVSSGKVCEVDEIIGFLKNSSCNCDEDCSCYKDISKLGCSCDCNC